MINGHSVGAILLVVGAGLVVAGVVVAVGTLLIVRAVRARRRRKRQEEARRREQEGRALLGNTGLMAIAATIEGVKLATKVGTDLGRQGFAPALAGSLRMLAEYAETDRPALRRVMADDGSVTLMFSDIEGSTALNQRLGDEAWLELLKEHDDIVRGRVRKHRGQVVKTQGDSFMVAFKELPPALTCAMEIQRELESADLATDAPIRVRIGLHHGEVTRQGRDVFGLNVALAARVAAEATGGEILVSSDFKRLAAKTDGVSFAAGRKVELKGIAETATVYPLRWQQTSQP